MVSGALTSAGECPDISEADRRHLPALYTHTAGVLALLEEPENELKVFALIRLNELVDNFWAEIAEDVTKMSAIHIL